MTREERCEMRLSECQGQSLQYTRVTYNNEVFGGHAGQSPCPLYIKPRQIGSGDLSAYYVRVLHSSYILPSNHRVKLARSPPPTVLWRPYIVYVQHRQDKYSIQQEFLHTWRVCGQSSKGCMQANRAQRTNFRFFRCVVYQNPFVPLQGTLLYPQEPRCRRAHEKPQWHRQIRTALPEQLK